jgi:hypothetical protein
MALVSMLLRVARIGRRTMEIRRFERKFAWVVALTMPLTACGSSDSTTDKDYSSVKIYVNELQPSNKSTIADEAGQFDDWIELYNATKRAQDLEGFYVSDSKNNVEKYQLPTGAVIPANGFLLLWADGSAEQGPTHLPFSISAAKGEHFQIADPTGKVLDITTFDIVTTHDSWARFPDFTGDFAWCAYPTPLATNGDACTPPADP